MPAPISVWALSLHPQSCDLFAKLSKCDALMLAVGRSAKMGWRMYRWIFGAVASLLSAQAWAFDKKPPEQVTPPTIPLRASDDWKIVETRLGCSLRAEIPGGRKMRAVVLTPKFGTASIASLQLELAPGSLPNMFNIGVKLGDAEPRAALGLPSQDSAGLRAVVRLERPELHELEMGSTILAGVPGETIAFSTSRAVPMLIRLGLCDQRALETAMGGPIPPAAVVATSVKGIWSLFTSDDYPKESLIRGQQGLVAVILRIGTDGRVRNCLVAETSGAETLDRVTCEIIRKRARYTPARDVNNGAVEGLDRARIRWLLPHPRGTTVRT